MTARYADNGLAPGMLRAVNGTFRAQHPCALLTLLPQGDMARMPPSSTFNVSLLPASRPSHLVPAQPPGPSAGDNLPSQARPPSRGAPRQSISFGGSGHSHSGLTPAAALLQEASVGEGDDDDSTLARLQALLRGAQL
jgi:hypothetical protein